MTKTISVCMWIIKKGKHIFILFFFACFYLPGHKIWAHSPRHLLYLLELYLKEVDTDT